MISNENDNQDFELFYREDRSRQVNVLTIDRWDNGVKFHKIVVEKNWLGVNLMNLSPKEANVSLKMSRMLSFT